MCKLPKNTPSPVLRRLQKQHGFCNAKYSGFWNGVTSKLCVASYSQVWHQFWKKKVSYTVQIAPLFSVLKDEWTALHSVDFISVKITASIPAKLQVSQINWHHSYHLQLMDQLYDWFPQVWWHWYWNCFQEPQHCYLEEPKARVHFQQSIKVHQHQNTSHSQAILFNISNHTSMPQL